MKYIIKNCPLYIQDTEECAEYFDFRMCKDVTDCPLKRIVERCSLFEFNYPVNQAIQMLTQNIKNMLEIEECENER